MGCEAISGRKIKIPLSCLACTLECNGNGKIKYENGCVHVKPMFSATSNLHVKTNYC